MFTFDTVIDQIQNTKKQAINTFVTNKAFAEPMVEFVDAQTAYTKEAVKTATAVSTKLASEATKVAQDTAKQIAENEWVKSMTDKAAQKFYDSFWKEAFKAYQANPWAFSAAKSA